MDKKNHEADLHYISAYLLSVFEFASICQNTVFDKAQWLSFSGADGEWLYALYEKDAANGRPMQQAIRRLFALDMPKRRRIYAAIDHDMKFAEDISTGFEFESTQLDAKARSIIEDFFLYFYKVVLCSAHFHLHGLTTASYNREKFAEQFFAGNNAQIKYVCPVCLQTMTNAQKEADIEHYFGKAFIPCLVLHPYNLYFACPVCNQRYKGVRNALPEGARDIRQVFLPYLDTVRKKVKIEFEHKKEEDCLYLKPADPGEPDISLKIESFNRLFSIKERWSGMLECYYVSCYKRYKNFAPADINALKTKMENDLKLAGNDQPETYLNNQYLEWLCQAQLKALYANIKHEGLAPHEKLDGELL